MSRHGTNRSKTIERPRFRGGRTIGRACTVWLAYLALLFQLAAAGSCAASISAASAAAGPFPICHAQSAQDDVTPGRNDHAPAPHGECPLCSIHCHTATLLPTAADLAVPFVMSAIDTDRPAYCAGSTRPFCVGASPRGPPSRA